MARTYSIYLVLPFSLERIPKHASTHYTYTVYPTNDIAPKTKKGVKRKPALQRKLAKRARPLTVAKPVTKSVAKQKTKKQRSKFRKNINKRVLAAYFDNDVKLSRAAAIKKWQDAVVAELAAADKIAYSLQADVESTFNAMGISPDELKELKTNPIREIIWQETTSEYSTYDEYDIDPDFDLYFGEFDDSELNQPTDNHVPNEKDDFYLFTTLDVEPNNMYPHRKSLSFETKEQERAEINESIVDRFTRKYKGADTAAAMRAFEKQKFHSAILPHILQKMQIVK